MPIEIKELIVRAIVGNAGQHSDKTKSGGDGCKDCEEEDKKRQQMQETMEQFKQMMLDNKER